MERLSTDFLTFSFWMGCLLDFPQYTFFIIGLISGFTSIYIWLTLLGERREGPPEGGHSQGSDTASYKQAQGVNSTILLKQRRYLEPTLNCTILTR
jgi:hypothetical protein